MADIPGLIEGASQGHGLGDRFLGHVERTSILLHLIDCTDDTPIESYRTIRHELAEYGADLENKEEIIALTKIDAIGPELAQEQADRLSEEIGQPVRLISAVSGAGIQDVLYALGQRIAMLKSNARQTQNDQETDVQDTEYADDAGGITAG